MVVDNTYWTVIAFAVAVLSSFSLLTPAVAENSPMSGKQVPAYTYHLKPPFVIDQQARQGLYYDLVDKISDDTYRYYLVYMPRKRLARLMEQSDFDGLVVGVSPHWFHDEEEKAFAWTQPFIHDHDDIVSDVTQPFDFQRSPIQQKTMAGVEGFFYINLNPFIDDGLVQRFDTASETQVIEMVLRQRADFGVISRSTFNYLLQHDKKLANIHISAQPHESFARRILIPKHRQDLHHHVQQRLEVALSSADWQAILLHYGIDSLMPSHSM